MRWLASDLGLSPALWPDEEGADWYKEIHRDGRVPGHRALGRTTRMLLSIFIDLEDGRPVVVLTTRPESLAETIAAWAEGNGMLVKAYAHRDEVVVCSLSGSDTRLWVRSTKIDLDRYRGLSRSTRFYCDHEALPFCPSLASIGQELVEVP